MLACDHNQNQQQKGINSAIFSTLLRPVTHVSDFPLGVVIIRVSIRGALFTHPCFWLGVKEGADIFHSERHHLSSLATREQSHSLLRS